MKYFISILFILFFCFSISAQVSFWTEDFEGNPCSAGCNPSTIGWATTNTGVNSGSANSWYVSCAENGNIASSCGGGCGSDESLHMGSTTLGDIGAAYDASQITNKRIESPVINCSGYNGITLNFNYITYGEAGFDYASLLYFDGTAWSTLVANIAQTTCCVGGVGGNTCNGFRQGYWTSYSFGLPASANNNANVRIGFNWTNDASSGLDPSFAVDDIDITYTTSLPVELLYFNGKRNNEQVLLEWVTESEINNDYFSIQRSIDGINFTTISTIQGSGNSSTSNYYSYTDYHPPNSSIIYYRLKQTDYDGKYSYHNIIAIDFNPIDYNFSYLNNSLQITSPKENTNIEIYDLLGKKIFENKFSVKQKINTSNFKPGVYILKLETQSNIVIKKMKF